MNEVTVVDYGVGNLLSVSRALERCGAKVTITSDANAMLNAKKVVLPGVGAFADGMAALTVKGLDDIVRQVARKGTPLLGICLGMQMLFEGSEEFGATTGLGLIPGRVVHIPATTLAGAPQKIPHIGWNELMFPESSLAWSGDIMGATKLGDAVYFVHSYMAVPALAAHRLADCSYGGIRISAAVQRGNVIGCQFHPEKSGEVGLAILQRFLEPTPLP